jgi:hypothetical protein
VWTRVPALLAGPVLRTCGRRRGGLCRLRVPRMVTLDQELAARDRADTAEEREQRGPDPPNGCVAERGIAVVAVSTPCVCSRIRAERHCCTGGRT